MIQRKQTLFLLASAILMGLLPFVSSAKYVTEGIMMRFNSLGFWQDNGELIQPTLLLFIFNVVIVLLTWLTIFLFKSRPLQMRFTIFTLLLKVGYIPLSYFLLATQSGIDKPFSVLTLWAACPIVAIIFDYLAHRGIAIDERTVRYMDRLR